MDNIKQLVIRQPDDWHVHLRERDFLDLTVNMTAKQFARAIVMPNLEQPITTAAAAFEDKNKIMKSLSRNLDFTPYVVAYLSEYITKEELKSGFEKHAFFGAKLYPQNSTTNSQQGVKIIKNLYPIFETMQRIGMPLLLHGETSDPSIDIFDREAYFIDSVLSDIVYSFPELRIVFEHITTENAISFIESSGPCLAATITPHHLIINRNAMFDGGINPHAYCLPIAKRECHRLALRKAATSGNPKFFLGTDSAPHVIHMKENACGCAGIFNSPQAMEIYATAFEQENALDKLESFSSVYGANFYNLPVNSNSILLKRTEQIIPPYYEDKGNYVIPFLANHKIPWTFISGI